MVTFDFDTPVVRRGSGCYKWDEAPQSQESDQENAYIPMWVADMDFPTAPAIIEALRRRVDHGVFGYTLVPESYFSAIISWFHRRHQWDIDREWIQYTSGVVPALSVIVNAFCAPGDEVILQTPVYNCFFSSVRNNGCQVVENPLILTDDHRYVMDYADLEQKVASPRAKLLILCNPHNPAGRVWSREELVRIDEICKKHRVVVVCDEIHNELTYRGQRYTPYGTIDLGLTNSIICTSPSKSFNTAGLQIANIICSNPEWRAKIDRAININEVCDVNPFGVVALQAAYNESEAWLDALCDYLWQNYQVLCDFFEKELPQYPVTPLEGTYLVWVDIRSSGLSSDELTEKLLREGHVQVNSGTMYGTTTGEGFIRINIACPRTQLLEALHRIKGIL